MSLKLRSSLLIYDAERDQLAIADCFVLRRQAELIQSELARAFLQYSPVCPSPWQLPPGAARTLDTPPRTWSWE